MRKAKKVKVSKPRLGSKYKTSKKGSERKSSYERYVEEFDRRMRLIEKKGFDKKHLPEKLSEIDFTVRLSSLQEGKKMKIVKDKDLVKLLVSETTNPLTGAQEQHLYERFSDVNVLEDIAELVNKLNDPEINALFNELTSNTLLKDNKGIRDQLKIMYFVKKFYAKYKEKFGIESAEMMTTHIYGS